MKKIFQWFGLVPSIFFSGVLHAQTLLYFNSDANDFIGQGIEKTWTDGNGSFTAKRNFHSGVDISYVDNTDAGIRWDLSFAAPGKVDLNPNTLYENAARFPFQDITSPGLSVGGSGRGCNTLAGSFSVNQIVYGAADVVDSFSAEFTQFCDGSAAALRGMVIFNANPIGAAAFTLGISKVGNGSGTVSAPAGNGSGINCGAACSEAYTAGTLVNVTANPAIGSGFGGWSGACSGTAVSSGVTMDADKVCTANFVLDAVANPQTAYNLTVQLGGTGNGTVSSTSAAINCGSNCNEIYSATTTVVLSANPATGSIFSAWGGDCSGTANPLSLVVDGDVQCLALFALETSNQGLMSSAAGDGTAGYAGDGGVASAAQLNRPWGLGADKNGNLYIADRYNHVIRKMASDGTISTVAGSGLSGFSGTPGSPATDALFKFPAGVSVSGDRIWIADTDNHRIRTVDAFGNLGTITYGSGQSGFGGDGGPAADASFNFPLSVVNDDAGNTYISDTLNHRIRKVNPQGVISTYAGTGQPGFSGDAGSALSARLNFPAGLALDENNNLYIADQFNHRVRKITSQGIISTVAGSGSAGYSGDGDLALQAQLNTPHGVALDGAGNLFIAEFNNHTVRKVDLSGVIYTLAGTGTAGYSGDGDSSVLAQMNVPTAVLPQPGGSSLYIADSVNNRVRRVDAVANPGAGGSGTGSAADYRLRIILSGDGSGSVSAPVGLGTGIDCGAACEERYPANSNLTLIATPANGSLFNGWSGDCNGSVQALSLLLVADQTCVATFTSDGDSDNDGVPNAVEAAAPHGGDGNYDGIADNQQSYVVSLPGQDNRYVTLATDSVNCTFSQVHNTGTLPQSDTYAYPQGLFGLNIQCSATELRILYHGLSTLDGTSYRQYGPVTPGSTTRQWYNFPAVSSVETIGTGTAGLLSLTLSDGLFGDSTTADGVLSILGGVGVAGGADTLSFTQTLYEVREADGVATLEVRRSAGSNPGAVSVEYVFEDGSARQDIGDYSATPGTLRWFAGDTAGKQLNAIVIDNNYNNSNREFTVYLRSPSGGASLGTQNSATVRILNDDFLSDAVRCPLQGLIDKSCNAMGERLLDITVSATGHATDGSLAGTLTSTGWISNMRIEPNASMRGGTVTGSIASQGIMADFSFHGSQLLGGTLSGTVRNGFGLVQDITFDAGAKFSGGKLGGMIDGNATGPVLLEGLNIQSGSRLTQVAVGAGVGIPGDVFYGAGINFTDRATMPANGFLMHQLPALAAVTCNAKVSQQQSLDLAQEYRDAAGILIDRLHTLPQIAANPAWVLQQNRELGFIYLDAGATRYAVQPFAMSLNTQSADMVLYDDESVTFILGSGVALETQPALQDPCAFQQLFGPRVKVHQDGNLSVISEHNVWYTARPALEAVQVGNTTPNQVVLKDSPLVSNYFVAAYVFTDNQGNKREQYLYPVSAQPHVLAQQARGVLYDRFGLVQFIIGTQQYQGVFDYKVVKDDYSSGENIRVFSVQDKNGDGIDDFEVVYPGRDRQILFAVP